MLTHKKKDILVLSYLRQHSRMTLTDLSRKSGVPISTLFDKLKTTTPFIRKYTTLIDFAPLGFSTRAMVVLKVKKNNRGEVAKFIASNHFINSAYKINNGCDYILDVVFRDMKELEDFLEYLDEHFKLEKQYVFYILEILKEEEFLAEQEHVNRFFTDDKKSR